MDNHDLSGHEPLHADNGVHHEGPLLLISWGLKIARYLMPRHGKTPDPIPSNPVDCARALEARLEEIYKDIYRLSVQVSDAQLAAVNIRNLIEKAQKTNGRPSVAAAKQALEGVADVAMWCERRSSDLFDELEDLHKFLRGR